jgi:hypothetical protein
LEDQDWDGDAYSWPEGESEGLDRVSETTSQQPEPSFLDQVGLGRPRRTMREKWWPTVGTVDSARAEARQVAYLAWVLGVGTGVISLITGYQWLLIDGVVWLALGVGVWKMSRIAAVACLALFLPGAVGLVSLSSGFDPITLIVSIAIAVGLVGGVRATFAYHSMIRDAPR